MTNFDYAVNIVLQHEGGYSNDPDDPGGETNYGITESDLEHYGCKLGITCDVKDLTIDDAKAIYKAHYWEPYRYDDIESKEIAAKLFDTAVNVGQQTAVKLLQQAFIYIGYRIKPDGLMGDKTLSAINNAYKIGLSFTLLDEFREALKEHYQAIADRNPKLKKFLKGWLNRAES